MTTTKQSWLKRSLAMFLAVVMVMGMGVTNAFAAEKTTLEQLQELIAYADTLEEADYTPESWRTFKKTRDAIVDPTQIPEEYAAAPEMETLPVTLTAGSIQIMVKDTSITELDCSCTGGLDALAKTEPVTVSAKMSFIHNSGMEIPSVVKNQLIQKGMEENGK